MPRPGGRLLSADASPRVPETFQQTSPLRTPPGLLALAAPDDLRQVVPGLPSSLLPAFTGRDFVTTMGSSAPRTASFDLGFPLVSLLSIAGTIRDFPSYLGLPVGCAILNHASGLTRYRALRYCARLPPCRAESGSLALCAAHFLSLPSDPVVAADALAIRIVFPLVGATPVSFNRPGLPATLGKLKRKAARLSGFPFSADFAICTKRRFIFLLHLG